MKTIATPILLLATALVVALLLAATSGKDSAAAQAGPPATSSPAASAHDRVLRRRPTVTRVMCQQLFGHDADSHGELGHCLATAR